MKFYEKTVITNTHTYPLNAVDLNTQLTGTLNNGNRDFEGTPNKEFYDVYLSNADGTLNMNGAFVSVEARFDDPTIGGGLNIIEVEFFFDNGATAFGRYITSFMGLGPNCFPGSEELAADCDLDTWSTMGSTLGTTMRLRVTIGLLNEPSTIIDESCESSGYEVTVNGAVYNELNSTGLEFVPAANGCDSLVYIDLTFHEVYSVDVLYEGCLGDGYSINIEGNVYSETNPVGSVITHTQTGCDSVINIQLEYEDCIRCAYFIPNVFSANRDAVNDEFRIYYDDTCEIWRFKIDIYDRWGDRVYSSSDFDFKWNAEYDGKILNPGVFVYVAEIYFGNDTTPTIEFGDVTLLR